jgi:mRNA-decapping enzyme 1B
MTSITDDARRQANLRVLQRSDPTIVDILESATHVGLYEFVNQTWRKEPVEGSLFLVQSAAPAVQLIILNRSSTDNWTLTVDGSLQIQNKDPYLILRHCSQQGDAHITGLWFHNAHERESMALVLQTRIRQTTESVGVILSQMILGNHTIPIRQATPNSFGTTPPRPQQLTSTPQQPATATTPTNATLVLDRKSLQLSLLSLIQDDRFLDLIHAQYLKVAHARANRRKSQQDDDGDDEDNA